MKTQKALLRISLQFFATDNNNSNTVVQDGIAAPQNTENVGGSAVEPQTNGSLSAEEEFESLIKGGKFEDAFKKRTQGIIDKRFKNLKSVEALQAKQQPVIDYLASKYGIDSSDTDLILQKLQNGDNNVSSEKKGADEKLPNAEKSDPDLRNKLISEKASLLCRRWSQESEQMKKLFPSFDLRTELKNPAFASLLKSGMPIRKAYTAAHSDELIEKAVSGTAKRVKEQALKSIRANGSRVAENGLSGGGAIIRKTDVASLTGKEIRSILKQVENGTKIRF